MNLVFHADNHNPDPTAHSPTPQRASATLPLCCELADDASTAALGALLAEKIKNNLQAFENKIHIWLQGDLGAGKTTLARGFLNALGHMGNVKSPTYTLLEPYVVSRIALYHFDFYRFTQAEEFLEAGLEEYFALPGICLVEWPDKAAPYLPQPDLEIFLDIIESGRCARLRSRTPKGCQCINALLAPPASPQPA